MRTPLIVGNWKMNNGPKATAEFIEALKPIALDSAVEASLCVPAVDLTTAARLLEGTGVSFGAQNMHFEDGGAYTGEISAPMLTEIGTRFVVLGHSERREYFGETDEMINRKVHQALKHELRPILCVGETLEEREAGAQEEKIRRQLDGDLVGLTAADFDHLVIAYEPIWAIGTGKTASAEDAQEICGFIRGYIRERFGASAAQSCRIQYGGSVKPDNVSEIMGKPDIDGALVGGASLVAESFAQLVNFKR